MFANRFTALVDACVLVGVLKRDLILTLAAAEFFRVRWSATILDETQRAIEEMRTKRGDPDAAHKAARSRAAMEVAFEDALVTDFEEFITDRVRTRDPNDAHVIAAALKTQAAVIVTDNLRDFPVDVLRPLNLGARSADDFIADTVALDEGKAVYAIRLMRERHRKPERTAGRLLVDMEAAGLVATVDILRAHEGSL